MSVPAFRAVAPPITGIFSIRMTLAPRVSALTAAEMPEPPAPTTTMSAFSLTSFLAAFFFTTAVANWAGSPPAF